MSDLYKEERPAMRRSIFELESRLLIAIGTSCRYLWKTSPINTIASSAVRSMGQASTPYLIISIIIDAGRFAVDVCVQQMGWNTSPGQKRNVKALASSSDRLPDLV